MAEYIKRKKVYKMLNALGGCGADPGSWANGWDKAIDTAIEELEEIPAADVAPVVHGRWEVYFICPWNGVIGSVRCSECGCVSTETGETGGNYCPRCGARMDGDEND